MLRASRQVALMAIVAFATALPVGMLHGQVDQRELARQLLGRHVIERSEALEAVIEMGVGNAGPELRAALITLLENLNRVLVETRSRGQYLASVEHPEFIARVGCTVAELQDQRAIPALSQPTGCFLPAIRALAAFGERAVAELVRVVTSPTSHYREVDYALLPLRFIVEASERHPLSDHALDRIRDAAEQRLTGEQDFTVLWRAIDLAVVLEDAELRQIVERLAADRNEVIGRGISSPDLIEGTQKRAADRLAGLPPLPRP